MLLERIYETSFFHHVYSYLFFNFLLGMPRYKARTTDRGTVPHDVMEQAVKSVVDDQKSIRSVCKESGISKTTLIRYIQKYKDSKKVEAENDNKPTIRFTPNYTHKQVFSEEEEAMLEDYIIEAARIHHGLSLKMTRRLAYEFALFNQKNFPDSWANNSTAGEDWLYGFRKRHPKISLRQPESTSLSRATSFNRHNVATFFENLKSLYSRFKFQAGDIYNVDETGVTTCHNPSKILAEKGSKQIGGITSAERGQLVTVCVGINALGNTIPPFFVFPRVNLKEHMLHGAPEGSAGSAYPSGWMTSEIFFSYMTHFIKHAKCVKEKPTLLLLDNHESHISIPVLEIAKRHGIHMLTFHPHTSHKMQPLDRTVFGPFKAYYNSACESWMLCHPGKPMTIYNISSAVGEAYPQALTMKNIQSGFKVTGIWPFNENIFQDVEFLSSYVTDQRSPDDDLASPADQQLSTADQRPDTLDEQQPNTDNQHSSQANLQPNTSQFVPLSTLSPFDLRPLPKACMRKTANKRKKGASKILTDTPVKKLIEEEYEKKEEKKMKQKNAAIIRAKKNLEKTIKLTQKNDKIEVPRHVSKQKKQNYVSESSSESENMSICSDTEYSDEEFTSQNADNFENEVKVGKYVLVKFLTKKSVVHFVGLVTEKSDDNVLVRFMRQKPDQNVFIFPDINDESLVNVEDIVMSLPDPTVSQESSRLSVSQISFDVSFANFNIR